MMDFLLPTVGVTPNWVYEIAVDFSVVPGFTTLQSVQIWRGIIGLVHVIMITEQLYAGPTDIR